MAIQPPRDSRPEWAARLRTTHRRRVAWSTVSFGLFVITAIVFGVLALHSAQSLGDGERTVVAVTFVAGLLVLTTATLKPLGQRVERIGNAAFIPATVITASLYVVLPPFLQTVIAALGAAALTSLAIVGGIGLTRDLFDANRERG